MKLWQLGERLAELYLTKKYYLIVAKNVRYRQGEIDLVARFNNQLIFIEVKARASAAFGYPELAFDDRKKQRLGQAIGRYLLENNYQGAWSVDLITLEIKAPTARLRHYQGVDISS